MPEPCVPGQCRSGRLLPRARPRGDDLGPEPCGIVSFTLHGVPATAVRDELRRLGVTVTVSRAPSTRLDMTARGLNELVRASPHYFVTTEQLDRAADSLATMR